jgi:TolB protein
MDRTWRMPVAAFIAALAAAAFIIAGALAAHATAPGENGRIAFRRYFNDAQTRGAIFTINPDGTGVRQITHRGKVALDTEPDWSPNGRWIAFQRQERGKPTRIFKVRPDGTHLTQLSMDLSVDDAFPAWSPSGHRISFTRFDDAAGLVEVFVMRADGTHAHQLIPSKYGATGAQWSPDGRRLVFGGGEEGTSLLAIFAIRLDGTHVRRLTPWKLHPGGVDWSPDGRWILTVSHSGQTRTRNLYLVRPNGTDLHRITDTFNGFPQWGSFSFSPDGTMITVAHNLGETGAEAISDVWVMNRDGSGLRDVTNSEIFDSAPDWGPRPT